MLFFSDSSDEQALGFSACYNKVKLEHRSDDLQSESVENIKFGRNKEYRLILILNSKKVS